jgi:hypothetical protein
VFADTAPLREQLCHELRHRSNDLSAVRLAEVEDALARAQARSVHGATASRTQAVAVLDQAAAFLEGGLAAIGATPARRGTA